MLAADAHKWLLGPCGAGLMYVRSEVQAQTDTSALWLAQRPLPRLCRAGKNHLSWRLAKIRSRHAQPPRRGWADGRDENALEIGVDNIARELRRKRERLVPALQAKGYSVLNADATPENGGGITSFFLPGKDLPALHAKLSAANVTTSLRTDRKGQKYLRLSPHFYNTDAELQRVVEML